MDTEVYNESMQDNAKVFVFEKKEIFLIFMFVGIMSVTCFTLGVNLGKKLALEKSGVTPQDINTVDMKSTTEESVDETLKAEDISEEAKLKEMLESSKEKLNQELKDFAADDKPAVEEKPAEAPVGTVANPPNKVTSGNAYVGKYTIQLGSYNSMDDAKQFAEGFTVRGYNPIINEVVIPEKGTWYRVSLGIFDTVAAAKDYIKQEATLFQGQQYVVSEIQ